MGRPQSPRGGEEGRDCPESPRRRRHHEDQARQGGRTPGKHTDSGEFPAQQPPWAARYRDPSGPTTQPRGHGAAK